MRKNFKITPTQTNATCYGKQHYFKKDLCRRSLRNILDSSGYIKY